MNNEWNLEIIFKKEGWMSEEYSFRIAWER